MKVVLLISWKISAENDDEGTDISRGQAFSNFFRWILSRHIRAAFKASRKLKFLIFLTKNLNLQSLSSESFRRKLFR